MPKIILIFILLCFLTLNISESIDLHWCYKKTFKVSSYYSPIYGQHFYYRWSFYKEKVLNWNWTHWASWRGVFNGMIAASKKYKFWTKIYFPGLWVWQVEDRWNAIVSAGKRWEKYDRIDIWGWKWDKALMRALSFWKQVRIWYVCPKIKKLKVWFDYSSFPIFKRFFQKTIWWMWLSLWRKDSWVNILQIYLKQLWYFHYKKTTWYFWNITKQAVMKFQKDYGIKTKYNGYFWPKTRYILKTVLTKKWLYKKTYNYIKIKKNVTMKKNIETKKDSYETLVLNDLKVLKRWLWKWYNTYEVKILQKYLKKMWYYNWSVNWFYDEKTVIAVSKFQFKYGIISKSNTYLAWYFWPLTRSTFKKVVIKNIVNS